MNSKTPFFTPEVPQLAQTPAPIVPGDDAGSTQPQPTPEGGTVNAADSQQAPVAPPPANLSQAPPAWLTRLADLLPIIAFGVTAMKKDADLGDKNSMAQDAFTVAVAGATVEVPLEEQPLVSAFSKVGANVLTTTLTMLHNAQTPAAA